MNKTIETLIQAAKKEIGTKEVPANSNKQKYGQVYGLNGQPWCVIFIWWLFNTTNNARLFCGGQKIASCALVKDYAQKNKQWVTSNYKAGDLLLFNFSGDTRPAHIGLAISDLSNGQITTIEGNTSCGDAGSQSNGGMVAQRTRYVKNILGAYRPAYTGENTVVTSSNTVSTSKVNISVPTLKAGTRGDAVKALQALLNLRIAAGLKVDGDFGALTTTAVKRFQQAKSLSADGIVGIKTWESLLN